MNLNQFKFLFSTILLSFLLVSFSIVNPDKESSDGYKNGAVVTAHSEASKVGLAILKKGGNAVDAAVAVHFALAVVYPNAGNIGGGGFMVYRSQKGEVNSLDFRETAPAAAHKDMYLDAQGNVIKDLSIYGHLSAGVPGAVDGMVQAHKKYGKLKWAELIEPAIQLARTGFKITAMQAREMNKHKPDFIKYNQPASSYLINTDDWKEGDVLQQEDLAKTLELIRDKGRAGFYEGITADNIVKEMVFGKGLISKEDLKNYKSVWRKPLQDDYRGYKIISMPPPSSGGIALLQLLKMVEPYDLKAMGWNTIKSIQLITEAERRVYADRSAYLGDPEYYKVPVDALLNESYLKTRMANFSFEQATPSSMIKPGDLGPTNGSPKKESEQTTHFSIVDKEGNAVAITTTLNNSYGSHVFVQGSGFLLNDEMDDFSAKPGVPNLYGVTGGEANSIQPGKRMLSSMTPTIVEKDGQLFMVVGTPGGSTIITTVFQTIVNVIDYNMNMQQAVDAGRVHFQWLPDVVQYEEKGVAAATLEALKQKGYMLELRNGIGRTDAILRTPSGTYQTGADKRGDDNSQGW
ncbi:gamma-glutamyltransferase [Solitalea sp. MAHUQ-68]|uniref:Glutathione hydrolase proenzyme n=1 Tax=Solitalea agri TaxID=2953739 RepID=A0A9X2F3Q1_9SPHI|nr:gamma-glutamyltransferase [Solitalea agri]MCO4293674.1 gamma-glutamyltransferase [Solitalea agri]